MLDFLKDHWKLIITVIVSIYEVLVRLIPTVANISIIHIIIEFLKWLSDTLNIKKNVKK